MRSTSIRKRRDFGDRISAAFTYFKEEWKGLLAPIFLYAGPILIILLGYSMYKFQGLYELLPDLMDADSGDDPMAALEPIMELYSTMTIPVLLNSLASILILALIGSYISLRENSSSTPTSSEVFSNAISSYLPFFGLMILSYILIIPGFMCFIIPGFILMVLLSMAYPSFFLDGTSVTDSIKNSFQLVKKDFFGTLGYLLVMAIIIVIVSGIFSMIVLAPIMTLGAGMAGTGLWIVGISLLGILALVGQIFNVILYTSIFMQFGHLSPESSDTSLEEEILAL